MAVDQTIDDVGTEETPVEKPKGKKKKLILIFLLILLIAGGGAGWYFSQQQKPKGPEKAKVEPPKPPIFVTLETFTVNLQGGNGDHYLQVGVDLKVDNQKVVDLIKLHMPEIRNSMLLLLSSKLVEDIATTEGKQKLSGEIVAQVNRPLGIQPPDKAVVGVYFTSFIIQ